MKQCKRLEQILKRKSGATSMEIIAAIGTVSPHSRMSELRNKGWVIRRVPVQGRTFGRYYGTPPLTWSVRGSR